MTKTLSAIYSDFQRAERSVLLAIVEVQTYREMEFHACSAPGQQCSDVLAPQLEGKSTTSDDQSIRRASRPMVLNKVQIIHQKEIKQGGMVQGYLLCYTSSAMQGVRLATLGNVHVVVESMIVADISRFVFPSCYSF